MNPFYNCVDMANSQRTSRSKHELLLPELKIPARPFPNTGRQSFNIAQCTKSSAPLITNTTILNSAC